MLNHKPQSTQYYQRKYELFSPANTVVVMYQTIAQNPNFSHHQSTTSTTYIAVPAWVVVSKVKAKSK